MSADIRRGPVYTVPLDAVALSTAGPSDLFCATAASNSKLVLREVRIGQYSEFADAQAELLPVQIMTGSTAVSGGSTAAARNVEGHSGAPTAAAEIQGQSTTLASTASAVLRLNDSWNVAAGWIYAPLPAERIVVQPSEIVNIRVGTPNDAVTLNATLVFEEPGS